MVFSRCTVYVRQLYSCFCSDYVVLYNIVSNYSFFNITYFALKLTQSKLASLNLFLPKSNTGNNFQVSRNASAPAELVCKKTCKLILWTYPSSECPQGDDLLKSLIYFCCTFCYQFTKPSQRRLQPLISTQRLQIFPVGIKFPTMKSKCPSRLVTTQSSDLARAFIPIRYDFWILDRPHICHWAYIPTVPDSAELSQPPPLFL